ncbi:MAG: DUF882 domain-containing protein [Hyphomicrobiales bacterium]|nr:DUF882 domain-containing protein [Hyphomicrobiales bacterium]MCP5372467.1 DUF882 domain-containing protein [Hyphomicrobiales bacterium]
MAAAAPARPRPAAAAGDRTLAYLNLHTGEKVTATYWADGAYLDDGLGEMDRVLRDFRTGEVTDMDRRLYDLLHALRRRLDTDAPFHVISGYRSPRTNAALAQAGGGVAKRSLHMRGMAIDIRVPGRSLKALHRAARSLRGGGVGLYPRSNFVHVDVGRVRYW